MTEFPSSRVLTIAGALLAVLGGVCPASAATPGISASGGEPVLQVGRDLRPGQRVRTDVDGKAHLIFADGSALSIGPSSDLVLEEFAYDPGSGDGRIALTAARGAFRFVGGTISKTTPVTLNMPGATVNVRGGIAVVTANESGVAATLVYGVDMVVEAQGEAERAERPGSLIQVPQGGAPQSPTLLTAEQAEAQGSAFEGAEQGGGPAGGDEDVFGSRLTSSDSPLGDIDISPPAAELPSRPPAPQAGVQDASQLGSRRDSFFQEPVAYSGRLKRRYQSLMFDDEPGQNLGITGVISTEGFSGTPENGAPLEVAFDGLSPEGALSGVADPQPFGGPLPAAFIPIFGDPEFLAVDLFDAADFLDFDAPRYFGFLGLPTPAASIPPSGIQAWRLSDPFELEGSAYVLFHPNIRNVPQNAYAVWDRGSPGAPRAFLIPSVTFSGRSEGQVSQTRVVVGRLLDDAIGRPFLQARLRGADRFDISEGFFGGGLSTADGGEGSDFFGSSGPKYFVLESSTVDEADSVVSRGLTTPYYGGLHFPTVYGSPDTYQPKTRTTRTLGGFATGFVARIAHRAAVSVEPMQASASGVAVVTDASTNRVSANFDFVLGESGLAFDIRLGGGDDSSAFIDDGAFAAIDRQIPASTFRGVGGSELSAFLTARPEQLAGILPDGVSLCECRHAAWGFLSTQLEESYGNRVQATNVPVVLGEIAQPAQFSAQQSATYSGHAFGTVVRNRPAYVTSSKYTVVGAFSLGVTFAPGQVSVTSASLTNFDNGGSLSLAAQIAPQAAPNYAFAMSGTVPGVAGTVSATGQGTFVGPGAPPGTTIGRIGGVGANYQFEVGYVAERPGAP